VESFARANIRRLERGLGLVAEMGQFNLVSSQAGLEPDHADVAGQAAPLPFSAEAFSPLAYPPGVSEKCV
jgi:hypothetical protein